MAVSLRLLAIALTAFVVALPFGRNVIVGVSHPSTTRPNIVLVHGTRAGGHGTRAGGATYRPAFLHQRSTRPHVLGRPPSGPITTTPVIPDPKVRALVCVTRQRTIARQFHPGTFVVEGGHLSMLSSPGALADLIIAAVRKTH